MRDPLWPTNTIHTGSNPVAHKPTPATQKGHPPTTARSPLTRVEAVERLGHIHGIHIRQEPQAPAGWRHQRRGGGRGGGGSCCRDGGKAQGRARRRESQRHPPATATAHCAAPVSAQSPPRTCHAPAPCTARQTAWRCARRGGPGRSRRCRWPPRLSAACWWRPPTRRRARALQAGRETGRGGAQQGRAAARRPHQPVPGSGPAAAGLTQTKLSRGLASRRRLALRRRHAPPGRHLSACHLSACRLTREVLDLVQHLPHIGHHVLAVHIHLLRQQGRRRRQRQRQRDAEGAAAGAAPKPPSPQLPPCRTNNTNNNNRSTHRSKEAQRRTSSRGMRSAVCSTDRSSVLLMCSPANMAFILVRSLARSARFSSSCAARRREGAGGGFKSGGFVSRGNSRAASCAKERGCHAVGRRCRCHQLCAATAIRLQAAAHAGSF